MHPVYPYYAMEEKRLKSFETWCQNLIQKPEVMVDAGFFFTGQNDKVICYFCGGKLKDWSPEDIPWFAHARYFPFCPYVLLRKGETFVQSVISESCEIAIDKNHEQPVNENKPICLKTSDNEPGECEKSLILCKICLVKEVQVCYRPCNHVITCVKCALSLNKLLCPICRTEIINMIRIYLA